ncbi:MAG: phosphoenolpyruvate carboxykinase (ATP), partial [Planctomycetota bacterium]
VGTNPFIIGPAEEEGNWFYKALRDNPQLECYVMNTGRVGGVDGEKIKVLDSAEIIKQIARGAIKWQSDPDWHYQVPSQVENLDMKRFDPLRFYSPEEYKNLVAKLKDERKGWLGRFLGLSKPIKQSIPG